MFFYQSEKAEAHKEVKKLQSQRTLLERDLWKRDSVTVDKKHELNCTLDQAVQMQVFIILANTASRMYCHHGLHIGVTSLALLQLFIDH